MIIRGVAASPGVGIAPALRVETAALSLPAGPVDDVDAEISALTAAAAAVADDLQSRADEAGGEVAEILGAQALMANDPELTAAAAGLVREHATPAARAVVEAGEPYAAALAASGNAYLAARATDVRDVCRRVAARLMGVADADLSAITEPFVVVAADLAPADTAQLKPALVRGLATEAGSRTSHTAILARALGVPAVVAARGLLDAVVTGAPVAVDGDVGQVVVDPTPEEIAQLSARPSADQAVAGGRGPAVTADGQQIELAANIASVAELEAAMAKGAHAVGLLRTELAYLNRSTPPTQAEQQELFSRLAALLDGGRLVIRTFDFGADKPVPFLASAAERNPALGVRGLRLGRRHPELLDAQLRAVAGAATAGRVAVMAPMVATPEEADWFRERVRAAGGHSVEVGAMVEVPSAVLLADELAERLDFLSLGTNDLNQYLHAADRQEGELAHLQDPFSPALLRAVAMVCAAAARHDAWVGVCGEAASEPDWAVLAVGLGVTELSMGAGSLPAVRARLAGVTLARCRAAAAAALQAHDPAGVRAAAAAAR